MLGRRYGTRPPAAYYQEMSRNPDAFRFQRGRAGRARAAAVLRGSARATRGPAGVGPGGPAGVDLGPRDQPVVGDFHVPVVLGLFSDSPTTPPVTATAMQTGYFGPQPGTVAEFYAEVSNDSIALFGSVQDWVTSSMTQAQVTQGISALGCCGIGDYIKTLLAAQSAMDWGAFDNDGSDGVPNSGDDDGYVDALAVVHPTPGAECTGTWPNRIWSHKWTLSDASTSHTPYVTSTPASGGGFIRVDDYFVQPAVKCSGVGLNDIGVFAHETGHAFGLPDLYDTRPVGGHEGAGQWDLMAGGTYGCSGTAPYSPCHMSAWSKAALGWVTVDTLPPDTDFGTLTLPPVETSGLVYRVDAADGSDEYFLLENRQRGLTAFDQLLPGEGLLIWQIDAGVVDARWPANTVNSADHMGVWLRQADGLDELGSAFGDRGDAGDPFPGSTGNTAFNAATNPASRSYEGTAVGLSVLDVSAPPVSDDVTLHVITGFAAMADQVVDLVATIPSDVQLAVQRGTSPFTWMVVLGTLPSGITLQTGGLLTGRTATVGSFGVTVEVTDALGLTARALVTLDVTAPSFSIAQLSDSFLLGDQPLDSIQAAFLDQQGNGNGTYDLGDFREWVLAHPGLPLSAGLPPAPTPREPSVLVLPVVLQAPGERP
jgi:M6 family metalloprotease-like protein